MHPCVLNPPVKINLGENLIMLTKTALGLAVLVFATSSAFASRTQPYQITFANPVPARANSTVLADIAWRCEANSCVSASDINKSTEMRACKTLAKRYGQVTAFTGPAGTFDAEKLTKCNEVVKK
jgi:hypothetical protein